MLLIMPSRPPSLCDFMFGFCVHEPTFHLVRHVPTHSSCQACGAMQFDKLDTDKMHGLDTSNVLSCDVTSQVEFGLY